MITTVVLAAATISMAYSLIFKEELNHELEDIAHDRRVSLGRPATVDEIQAHVIEYTDQIFKVVTSRARERFLTEYPTMAAFFPFGPLSTADEMVPCGKT